MFNSVTVCTWKRMVGRLSLPFGSRPISRFSVTWTHINTCQHQSQFSTPSIRFSLDGIFIVEEFLREQQRSLGWTCQTLGPFGDSTLVSNCAQACHCNGVPTAFGWSLAPQFMHRYRVSALMVFEFLNILWETAWSFRKPRHLIHCHIHSLGPWNSLRSSRLGSWLVKCGQFTESSPTEGETDESSKSLEDPALWWNCLAFPRWSPRSL